MIRGRRFLVKRVNYLWCRQVDKRLEWYHGYGLAPTVQTMSFGTTDIYT